MKIFLKIFIKKKIFYNLLEINSEKNDEFDLDRTMKNLYKYKNHLTREEMEYIDKNINEHNKIKKVIALLNFRFLTCRLMQFMF